MPYTILHLLHLITILHLVGTFGIPLTHKFFTQQATLQTIHDWCFDHQITRTKDEKN